MFLSQLQYTQQQINKVFSHSWSILFRHAKPEFYCHTKRSISAQAMQVEYLLLHSVLRNTTPHSTARFL
jgi:hypothetical protein